MFFVEFGDFIILSFVVFDFIFGGYFYIFCMFIGFWKVIGYLVFIGMRNVEDLF